MSKEALVPLFVEWLQNYFQEISLIVCYDEMIVGPDGTAYHTHKEADNDNWSGKYIHHHDIEYICGNTTINLICRCKYI